MRRNDLLHKDLTHQIIGCAMNVHNDLGHGLLEKPYENALAVELNRQNIPFQQQPRFNVIYQTIIVGEYIPDLVIANTIIVDTKVVEHIAKHEMAQMINYLKITKLQVGLILNFRHPQLQWQRVVNEHQKQPKGFS